MGAQATEASDAVVDAIARSRHRQLQRTNTDGYATRAVAQACTSASLPVLPAVLHRLRHRAGTLLINLLAKLQSPAAQLLLLPVNRARHGVYYLRASAGCRHGPNPLLEQPQIPSLAERLLQFLETALVSLVPARRKVFFRPSAIAGNPSDSSGQG